jgi:hypothetical protein
LLAVPNDNSTYFFWTGVGDARTIAGKFSNELQSVFPPRKFQMVILTASGTLTQWSW